MIARVQGSAISLDWRDIDGNRYEVFRSTHEAGDYEFLTATSHPFHLDEQVSLAEPDTKYFYKIRSTVEGEQTLSDWFTFRYEKPDRIAMKIIREYTTMLKMMQNPPMTLLARKRFARKCPNCYNPISNKRRFSECDVCDGNGEMSGYHLPFSLQVSRDISSFQASLQPEDIGKVDISPISGWVLPVPSIAPDDILIDQENQRYIITSVQVRTKSQSVVRYMFQASPLEKGHPAYQLKIEEVTG